MEAEQKSVVDKFESVTMDYNALVDFFYSESNDLIELKASLADIEETMRTLETKYKSVVLSETDEKGKPLFSNETTRNVETKNRLINNSTYTKLSEEARQIETLIKHNELNILKTKYKISLKKRELDFLNHLLPVCS